MLNHVKNSVCSYCVAREDKLSQTVVKLVLYWKVKLHKRFFECVEYPTSNIELPPKPLKVKVSPGEVKIHV